MLSYSKSLGLLYTRGEKPWIKSHKGHGSFLRSQPLNLMIFGYSIKWDETIKIKCWFLNIFSKIGLVVTTLHYTTFHFHPKTSLVFLVVNRFFYFFISRLCFVFERFSTMKERRKKLVVMMVLYWCFYMITQYVNYIQTLIFQGEWTNIAIFSICLWSLGLHIEPFGVLRGYPALWINIYWVHLQRKWSRKWSMSCMLYSDLYVRN